MKIKVEPKENIEDAMENCEVAYVSLTSITDELKDRIDKIEKLILKNVRKKNWTKRRWK